MEGCDLNLSVVDSPFLFFTKKELTQRIDILSIPLMFPRKQCEPRRVAGDGACQTGGLNTICFCKFDSLLGGFNVLFLTPKIKNQKNTTSSHSHEEHAFRREISRTRHRNVPAVQNCALSPPCPWPIRGRPPRPALRAGKRRPLHRSCGPWCPGHWRLLWPF